MYAFARSRVPVYLLATLLPLVPGCAPDTDAASSADAGAGAEGAARADTAAERRAIEAIIAREVTDQDRAEDIIVVTGRYDRPLIGAAELRAAEDTLGARIAQTRPNEKAETELVRIEVAPSGDMAYDVTNFTNTWDAANGQSTGFRASRLRVWRKTGGRWQVATQFTHPWEDINPQP
jgi:ketosteroid isomerase-like protein